MKFKIRTVQLTNDELSTAIRALEFAYLRKLRSIEINRKLMSREEIDLIVKEANKFIDLSDKLNLLK